MNSLFRAFRKPEWESKNASKRLAAIRHGDAPELLALLPELAQSDPEPEVRMAALRRVDDLSLLERRMRGERESAVAGAARDRLIQLLLRKDVDAASALAALRLVHDSTVLTRVAEAAEQVELRWLAIERIERPGYRVQRCIEDGDASLRLRLLDTIDDADALLRIAEAVRKRDKRLSRAARDKHESAQRASGDVEALRRQALQLGDAFSELARGLPVDRETRLQALRDEWLALHDRVDADLQRRVDGALAMADAAMAAIRGESIARAATPTAQHDDALIAPVADGVVPAAESTVVADLPSRDEPEPLPELPALPPLDVDDFDAQMRAWKTGVPWDARSKEACDAHRQAHQSWRQEQDASAAARFAEALGAAEEAFDAGHGQQAREALPAGDPPKALRGRHRALLGKLAKLERWQRWSSNSVRVRLCDEVEALHGSGLHPDALAQRVRELQHEWSEVEAHDPIDPQHGLARRFRSLCHRAIAPAKPYFEKRQALRAEHAGEVEALIERCATLPVESEPLLALRGEVSDAQRALPDVTPQRRRELGDALRAIWTRIDEALKQLRERAEADKRSLIAHLRRDLGALHGADALQRAKSAQQTWKQLPRTDRKLEDALWRELRELVDPLFAAVKSADDARRAGESARREAAQILLDEARALLDADDQRLMHAAAHVESLKQRWRELNDEVRAELRAARGESDEKRGRDAGLGDRGRPQRPGPRVEDPLAGFERDLDRVLAQVLDKAAAVQRRRRMAQFDALLDWVGRWPLDEDNAVTFADALQAGDWTAAEREGLIACAQATPVPAQAEVAARAERLVVQAELATGIDSPPSAAELRRQLQMQRLADKLSGQTAEQDTEALLRGLLLELCVMDALDPAQRGVLLQRWHRACVSAIQAPAR